MAIPLKKDWFPETVGRCSVACGAGTDGDIEPKPAQT